jgi:DNA-binding CsgD family transcriptional regulator
MLEPPDPTSPFQLVQSGTAAVYLGRSRVAHELLYRAVQAARVGGMTGDLPYVLLFVASVEESRGRYATAQSLAEEGRRLAEDTGQVSFRCLHQATLALLAAIQGDEVTCQRLAAEVRDVALPRHLGLPAARAGLALALLDLGAGRYPHALARFEEVAQAPPGFGHPGVVMGALPDWIEAAARAGEVTKARQQLAVLEALTAVADDWTRAVLACCQALLADDDTAGELYEQSLALHREAATPPPHVARAHLLYGEWLRRTRQRSRSRAHLRTAMEMYDRLGARPWAARARTELRASGETLRRRDDAAEARLTPQELRIAQSVVAGQSTKDIAALLFLSPRTVEYHIYKIFPKLGVTNRAQLVRAVTERPELIDQPA